MILVKDLAVLTTTARAILCAGIMKELVIHPQGCSAQKIAAALTITGAMEQMGDVAPLAILVEKETEIVTIMEIAWEI